MISGIVLDVRHSLDLVCPVFDRCPCENLNWVQTDQPMPQANVSSSSFLSSHTQPFSSLGTFEQKKTEANSDHTDASE